MFSVHPRVGAFSSGWLCLKEAATVPERFVKVTNEVINGPDHVAAYLDDVIVFDPDSSFHVINKKELFLRFRKHTIIFSPLKATICATDADFLGPTISPVGGMPIAQKVEALTERPMPKDLKQLRSLLGALAYCREPLCDIAKRIRLITSFLRQGVMFLVAPATEPSCGNSWPSGPRFRPSPTPTGTPSTDDSRPFLQYCDASVDGVGATLEQE